MADAKSSNIPEGIQWERPCDICKNTPTFPFEWFYDSDREGQTTRINYFCTYCEANTRHMCASKVAEMVAELDTGYRVSIEETREGIKTYIYDGNRKGQKKPSTIRPKVPQKRTQTEARAAVYLLQMEGFSPVKIGHAGDAEGRRQALQIGSPFRLVILRIIPVSDAPALERQLQARYDRYKVQGEWYDLPADVLAALLAEAF